MSSNLKFNFFFNKNSFLQYLLFLAKECNNHHILIIAIFPLSVEYESNIHYHIEEKKPTKDIGNITISIWKYIKKSLASGRLSDKQSVSSPQDH